MVKVIGITGGVGAGKSTLLKHLSENYKCKILVADEIAKSLYTKGSKVYERLMDVFGDKILTDEEIDRQKFAAILYDNERNRIIVNSIVHPEVKNVIIAKINESKALDDVDYIFVETALIYESHYEKFCDEVWYVESPAEVRKKRLSETRGYSDEKSAGIMKSQLDDKAFREKSDRLIKNAGSLEDMFREVDSILQG